MTRSESNEKLKDTLEESDKATLQTQYEIYMGLGAAAVFLYFFKAVFYIFVVNRYVSIFPFLQNQPVFNCYPGP